MVRAAAALSLSLAIAAGGCCVSPPPPMRPTPCGPGCSRDGGPPIEVDASPIGPRFDLCATSGLGLFQPCDGTCAADGLTCFRERRATAAPTLDGGPPADAGVVDLDGTVDPDAGVASPSLDAVAFPGGLCTIACRGDDDCNAPASSPCARCVPYALAGRARLRGLIGTTGVCRPVCDPSFSGTCPAGYACDPTTGACLEACTSDEQCRFYTEDLDGDGIDDALGYDADPEVTCDVISGRCQAPRDPIGGACRDASECELGYTCVIPRDGGVGYCALGCSGVGSCGATATCIADSRVGFPVCAPLCAVGAEPPDDVAGRAGHGAGCPTAFLCRWDRASTDPVGGCVPGEYNDVPEPNTGAPCVDDGECWSPYGRALCIRPHPRADQGVCAVVDCVPDGSGEPGLLPGVPVADLARFCDPARGLACVPLITSDAETACVRSCTAAEECLPGWACTRLLGSEERACAPNCEVDEDCAAGGSCRYRDTTPCAGRPGSCFCF